MQALAQLCNTNNTPLDTIGEFLGVPKQWRKIRTPVVERQCCDLIKLMFRLNRKYVSGLILQCELTHSNSAANSAAMLPSSSFKALHALLAVRQWCQNKDATRFLKEIAADIPQTLPRRRSTSQGIASTCEIACNLNATASAHAVHNFRCLLLFPALFKSRIVQTDSLSLF